MTRTRNILLIHSDQHRFDCVGVNGHPLIRTPHLDRLAAQGVNYTHAFTTIPICSAARASLLTGTWPHVHGCLGIPRTEGYRPAEAHLPVWTSLLHDAGYFVAHVGKFHQELPGNLLDYGVDHFVNAWHYAAWRQSQGLPSVPAAQGWFGGVDAGIGPGQSRSAWLADHVIALLERRAREPDRPFIIRWDPPEPHLPNLVPEPFASMYDPAEIPPWPSFPDPLTGKPYAQRQQRRDWGVEGWTWPQWAPIVARYLADISLLDAQIGRVMDTLDQSGLADRTVVIYTSDHGDMCGAHGTMDKHFNMYDDIMRVPLIVRGLEGEPGTVDDRFISQEIDLAATICDVAGLPPPPRAAGRSLRDTASPPRTDIYAVYFGTESGLYSQRMVRDRQWKYIYNATAEDELYHLPSDPGELLNRAEDPRCRQDLQRLRRRLVQWMRQADDPLLNRWTVQRLELPQTALSGLEVA